MSAELKPGEFLIARDAVSTKHRLAPDQSWPRSWPLMIGPTDCRGEPLDLDAVPEPTDSAAPREVHQPGAAPLDVVPLFAAVDALPEDARAEMLSRVGPCPRCGAAHRARFCRCGERA